MTKTPLVSIFISYYNDAKYLPIAIEAVLNSSYKNFELILLNHATTDNCREIAHSYTDERIHHIDMPYNLGLGGSGLLMQKCLEKTQGKYAKFLCADDIIRKDGLELLVEFMEKHPKIDFAFGNVEYIDEKGKSLGDTWFSSRPYFCMNDTEADCLRKYAEGRSFLPWVGSIVKTSALRNISLNKTFVMLFDMSVWVSLLCKGYKIGFLDQKVANYRIHPEQTSSIEKEALAGRLSYWEFSEYWKLFLSIQDIDLCKKVWPNGRFMGKLSKVEDIPFCIAYEFFRERSLFHIRPIACFMISEMINDDKQRKYLEETFSYGIKEFREDCAEDTSTNEPLKKVSKYKKLKMKFYSTPISKASLLLILFVLIRKIYNIVCLKELKNCIKNYKNNHKKQKRYSL